MNARTGGPRPGRGHGGGRRAQHRARGARHPTAPRVRGGRAGLGPRRLRLDDVRVRAARDHGGAEPVRVRRAVHRRGQPRRLGLRRRDRRHARRPLRPGARAHLRDPRLLAVHGADRDGAELRAAPAVAHAARLHVRRRVGGRRRAARRVRRPRAPRAHDGAAAEHVRDRLGGLHRGLPHPLRRHGRRGGVALPVPARHPPGRGRVLHPPHRQGPGARRLVGAAAAVPAAAVPARHPPHGDHRDAVRRRRPGHVLLGLRLPADVPHRGARPERRRHRHLRVDRHRRLVHRLRGGRAPPRPARAPQDVHDLLRRLGGRHRGVRADPDHDERRDLRRRLPPRLLRLRPGGGLWVLPRRAVPVRAARRGPGARLQRRPRPRGARAGLHRPHRRRDRPRRVDHDRRLRRPARSRSSASGCCPRRRAA